MLQQLHCVCATCHWQGKATSLLLLLLLLQVSDEAPVAPPTREGSIELFGNPDVCRLTDQQEYTNRHNTWLAVRVPADVAKVCGLPLHLTMMVTLFDDGLD
jgi:hypothetical protein